MAVAERERTEARTMGSNPDEPERCQCKRCGEIIVMARVAGRKLALEHPEVTPEDARAGLFVGILSDGSTRPVRMPSARGQGEALHRQHRCGHA